MARRCDWHPQFDLFTAASLISHFHHLSESIFNLESDISFTAEKKGGSACLDMVLVRQNEGLSTGLHAPHLNE